MSNTHAMELQTVSSMSFAEMKGEKPEINETTRTASEEVAAIIDEDEHEHAPDTHHQSSVQFPDSGLTAAHTTLTDSELVLGVKTDGARTLNVSASNSLQVFDLTRDYPDFGRLVEAEIYRGPSHGSIYEFFKKYRPTGKSNYLELRQRVIDGNTADIKLRNQLLQKDTSLRNPLTKFFSQWEVGETTTFDLKIVVQRSGVINATRFWLLLIPRLTLSLGFLQLAAVAFLQCSALLGVLIEVWYIVCFIDANASNSLKLFFSISTASMILHTVSFAISLLNIALTLVMGTWQPIFDFEYMKVNFSKNYNGYVFCPTITVGSVIRLVLWLFISITSAILYSNTAASSQLVPGRLALTVYTLVNMVVGAVLFGLYTLAIFARWIIMMTDAVELACALDNTSRSSEWARQLSWRKIPPTICPRCCCRVRPTLYEFFWFLSPFITIIIFTVGVHLSPNGAALVIMIPLVNYYFHKHPQWVRQHNLEEMLQTAVNKQRIKKLHLGANGLLKVSHSIESSHLTQMSGSEDEIVDPEADYTKSVTVRARSRTREARKFLHDQATYQMQQPSWFDNLFLDSAVETEQTLEKKDKDEEKCCDGTCGGKCTCSKRDCDLMMYECGRELLDWSAGDFNCGFVFCCYAIIFALILQILLSSLFQPRNYPLIQPVNPPHYSVCESQFISNFNTTNSLDALDMTFLTNMVYYPLTPGYKDMQKFIDAGLGPGRFKVLNWCETCIPPNILLVSPDEKLVILAIRGTSSVGDAVEDIVLYGYAVYIQVLSTFIPLTDWWSAIVVRSVLGYCDAFRSAISGTVLGSQFRNVIDYSINATKWLDGPNWKSFADSIDGKNRTFYVVGHSLGGGISKLVGGYLRQYELSQNAFSVGVSPPGTKFTSALVRVDPDFISSSAVSIVPAKDYFPTVDGVASTVHFIDCPARQAFTCHNPLQTLCTLEAACGRARNHHIRSNHTYYRCLCTKEPKACL